LQEDELYKICGNCGKQILINASVCKHCGHQQEQVKTNNVVGLLNNTNHFDFAVSALCFLIIFFALSYSFLVDVYFRLTHLVPHVSYTLKESVDPKTEQVQTNLKTPYQLIINSGKKNQRILLLQATYSLYGVVVAKNDNFWVRGFMRNEFDDTALMDLGIVWGDISDKKYYTKLKFKSTKTLGQARRLEWKYLYFSPEYIDSHVSHNHIIPANENIMSALLSVKIHDKVRLDGYLTDIITTKGITMFTSLSRTDSDNTSRGNGACEIFYVTGIQIGNKYYK